MVSGLNATLARLSAIESNFSALEGFSNKINQSYAMRNYGASNEVNSSSETLQNKDLKSASKVSESEDFLKILNSKDKVEKKSEEIFEQALDTLGAQEIIQKPTLLEKIEKTPALAELKEKIEQLSPIDTLKGKIEELAPQETIREKIDQGKVKNIDEIISSISRKYEVDENFVRAIIKQESGFNPNATSKKGAMGLMQLMPKTAKGLGVLDAYNPEQNVEGGVKYIKSLMTKYDGDKKIALAAYNAGPTAVNRYGGIPPYKETQNYVNKVMAIYENSGEVKL